MVLHDDCKLTFLELKERRTFRSIVYKIEDNMQVIVEKHHYKKSLIIQHQF